MISFAESCTKLRISQEGRVEFTNFKTISEDCRRPIESNLTRLFTFNVPFTAMPTCFPSSISFLSIRNDEISMDEVNKASRCLSLPKSLETLAIKYTGMQSFKGLFCQSPPHLKTVWISNCKNNQPEFDFIWPSTIEVLYFDYCGLNQTHENFSNATKLRDLRLRGNNLRSVPSNLPCSLRVLDLKKNMISIANRDTWSCISGLTELSFMYNKLTSFPERLPQSLESLDLSFNFLEYIPSFAFEGFMNLTRLILSNNR